MPEFTILHTNDLHNQMEKVEGALQELRPQHTVYFDSGDSVGYGNLAVPLRADPCWPAFERLRCTASVLGNRESHFQPKILQSKLSGLNHPVAVCNLFDKSNRTVFPPSLTLDSSSVRGLEVTVGVIGAMIEITPKDQALLGFKIGELSALHWQKAEPLVQAEAKQLRSTCDVVILLSHLGLKRDLALAESTPEIDIILGGHSHNVLETPLQIGHTYVAHGGSHGFYAGTYCWTGSRLEGGLVPLRPKPS